MKSLAALASAALKHVLPAPSRWKRPFEVPTSTSAAPGR